MKEGIMVDSRYIKTQLKKISFDKSKFNKPEIAELVNIIHDNESIYECVNGFYEGGFGLLVATDTRVLLVDKKIWDILMLKIYALI